MFLEIKIVEIQISKIFLISTAGWQQPKDYFQIKAPNRINPREKRSIEPRMKFIYSSEINVYNKIGVVSENKE